MEVRTRWRWREKGTSVKEGKIVGIGDEGGGGVRSDLQSGACAGDGGSIC